MEIAALAPLAVAGLLTMATIWAVVTLSRVTPSGREALDVIESVYGSSRRRRLETSARLALPIMALCSLILAAALAR